MFEITNIVGRISTSILDKQRSEVANLAKYIHWRGLCTFQINISVTHYTQDIGDLTPGLAKTL